MLFVVDRNNEVKQNGGVWWENYVVESGKAVKRLWVTDWFTAKCANKWNSGICRVFVGYLSGICALQIRNPPAGSTDRCLPYSSSCFSSTCSLPIYNGMYLQVEKVNYKYLYVITHPSPITHHFGRAVKIATKIKDRQKCHNKVARSQNGMRPLHTHTHMLCQTPWYVAKLHHGSLYITI